MTDQVASTTPEAPAGQPAVATMTVELVIDSYRVTGELRSPGVQRRLVDILNLSDDPFVVVHDGTLEDQLAERDEPGRFETMQVHREGILFAIPRSDVDLHRDPFDIVKKAPVPATVTVTGFEITGTVYFVSEIDPATANIVGGHQFIPMTDVSIRAAARGETEWLEPVVAINLSRVRMFAPRSG